MAQHENVYVCNFFLGKGFVGLCSKSAPGMILFLWGGKWGEEVWDPASVTLNTTAAAPRFGD